MTLTEFLLARIAEDERHWANPAFVRVSGPELSALVLKMRAECEAKRRIADSAGGWLENESNPPPWAVLIMQTVAAVYADHPDYLEEWKP